MHKFTAGMYAWGGPGTIRLLETKYHSPRIDNDSFLTLYDENRLKMAKKVFRLSDVWVTFSWGFSDKTEAEDRQFILDRLHNFKKLGLRTHAYIQGFNLVTADFKNQDIFCTDTFGRKIQYSKGRSLTCPNNPQFVKILKQRVKWACEEDFEGIFIDNIIFGLPPSFIRKDLIPFFGCYCHFCQKQYQKKYHYSLPKVFDSQKKISDYLQFRTQSIRTVLGELSAIAHKNNKSFGVNLFDPFQIDSEFFQGYFLESIQDHLDYYFIENHFLPSKGKNNQHLSSLVQQKKKPVVVVSYDQGIGFEPVYTSEDFHHVQVESTALGYVPCYKVSEFTTKGIWHTIDFSQVRKMVAPVILHKKSHLRKSLLKKANSFDKFLVPFVNFWAVPIANLYFENKLINFCGGLLYKRQLHKWRRFEGKRVVQELEL